MFTFFQLVSFVSSFAVDYRQKQKKKTFCSLIARFGYIWDGVKSYLKILSAKRIMKVNTLSFAFIRDDDRELPEQPFQVNSLSLSLIPCVSFFYLISLVVALRFLLTADTSKWKWIQKQWTKRKNKNKISINMQLMWIIILICDYSWAKWRGSATWNEPRKCETRAIQSIFIKYIATLIVKNLFITIAPKCKNCGQYLSGQCNNFVLYTVSEFSFGYCLLCWNLFMSFSVSASLSLSHSGPHSLVLGPFDCRLCNEFVNKIYTWPFLSWKF